MRGRSLFIPTPLNGTLAAWRGEFAVQALGLTPFGRKGAQPIDHLCETAVGGDLAPKRTMARAPQGRIELQHVVARCSLRVAGPVIVERADASIAPNHVLSVTEC